jgi:FKBP-type peptidyl-prolyl cis-trans isomerase FklB
LRTEILALTLAIGCCLAIPAVAEAPKSPVSSIQTSGATLDQAYYAIGLNLGRSLRDAGIAADPHKVFEGLKDGLSGATPPISEEQMRAAMAQLQAQAQTRAAEKAAGAARANAAEGAAFLAANRVRPGVTTLPSGLQYEVLKAGTGPVPKADDTVSCHYRGTLIDGTEFDSSYKRGEPASFAVMGVIKGWTEALQRMPVGSKWRLVVPSDLAYGERGAGGQIAPGAVLVFEVELLAIEPKA